MTLGQRIQAERKRLGLSQEGLGEALGVTRQAISKWEADGAVPEVDKLVALSRLFHLPVGVLLGVEEAAARRTAPARTQVEKAAVAPAVGGAGRGMRRAGPKGEHPSKRPGRPAFGRRPGGRPGCGRWRSGESPPWGRTAPFAGGSGPSPRWRRRGWACR